MQAGIGQRAERGDDLLEVGADAGGDGADQLEAVAELLDVGVRAVRRLGEHVDDAGGLRDLETEAGQDVRCNVRGRAQVDRSGLRQPERPLDRGHDLVHVEAGAREEGHALRGLGGREPGASAKVLGQRVQRLELRRRRSGDGGDSRHRLLELRDRPDGAAQGGSPTKNREGPDERSAEAVRVLRRPVERVAYTLGAGFGLARVDGDVDPEFSHRAG